MDDFPAGPARPEPGRPRLTVVIPVHNGGADFERCLRRLRESHRTDFEILVVDDGSTDRSAATAEQFGARVIRHIQALGPAAARNTGALAAHTPLIFFLDADVAPDPLAIDRALARFDADPGLAALFGSYDDQPAATGLVSKFRNLLHHHVHQTGDFHDNIRDVHTFWTGLGVIRRETFLELGGFDPKLYRRPAIEDIELGYRLKRAGLKVVLARDVLATHLKRWTLVSMIRTDIFQRGVPWMLLIWRMKTPETDLNVSRGQRLCTLAVGMAWLCLFAMWLQPFAGLGVAAAAAAIVGLNRPFYAFLLRKRGPTFALASIPLHAVYYTCCGVSVAIALVIFASGKLRTKGVEAADAQTLRVDRPQGGSQAPKRRADRSKTERGRRVR